MSTNIPGIALRAAAAARARVARRDATITRPPDAPRRDRRPHRREAPVEAAVVADLQHDPRGFGCLDRPVGGGEVARDRLSQKTCLPAPRRTPRSAPRARPSASRRRTASTSAQVDELAPVLMRGTRGSPRAPRRARSGSATRPRAAAPPAAEVQPVQAGDAPGPEDADAVTHQIRPSARSSARSNR